MATETSNGLDLTGQICVVYCRVSSDRQAAEGKGSLDAQERNGLARAKALGLRVLYVVKDAESAWILDKRSKFHEVLNDAKAGKFSVMIVDRMNRFTRSEDLGEYMQVMTELRAAGVRLVFADKHYEESKTGQLQQFLDAYVSAGEQEARRNQSLVGKRNKVFQLHRPNPGSWPLYGYRWTDATKTQLEFDPGESGVIVRRIWHQFLYGDHPTLAGIAKQLNRDGIQTPREYAGAARPGTVAAGGPRWTATTIRDIVRNPVYWGGDEKGMVPTFTYSKHNEPTLVPAYAPAYVTQEEAARVKERLKANQQYARRNRRREPHTLMHGGLVRCAECGWALQAYTYRKPRKDGSLLTVYRCLQSNMHGVRSCRGVTISADTLDLAVLMALDEQLNKGHFLENLFAAWEQDAEAAMGNVRSIERTITETQQQIQNLTARLATYALDDPLAAPLEAHARQLQETLPGLEKRRRQAMEAVDRARANPALRAELEKWFEAWLGGVWLMPREMQREFLLALKAQVRLWRADERTPRAQIVIALPTSALLLPPAPDSPAQTDGRSLDVDVSTAEKMVADARGFAVVYNRKRTDTPEETPDEVMENIIQALTEQGYGEAVARRLSEQIAKRPSRHPRTAGVAAR
jgi:Resolvase, N terminal domain/Recombinase/Recombinase zinc beta ribbon domain